MNTELFEDLHPFIRIEVYVYGDLSQCSPREIRAYAREAYVRRVGDTDVDYFIRSFLAEELRRAWPSSKERK